MTNIIIPYYNDKENLSKALQSLRTQTNKMFVTTIIDDNSTESTEQDIKDIINNFNDLTIMYYRNTQNLGPGGARQRGIEIAHEKNFEYIMFLDSDDMLYPRAVEVLTREAKINNADLVYSTIHVEEESGLSSTIEIGKNTTWTHGKIYKTDFLVNNKIEFLPEIRYNEDSYFNLLASLSTTKKFFINEITYLWRNNKNSLTRKDSFQFAKDSLEDYIYGHCKAIIRVLNNEETAKEFSDESIILCLLNMYQKQEVCEIINDTIITKEINDLVKETLNLDRIKKLFSKKKNLKMLLYKMRVGEEVAGKFIFYEIPILDWLKRYGVEIKNEYIYNQRLS